MSARFLFDHSVNDSLGRVSINRILGGQNNEVISSSRRVAHFGIHFIGRAYICPGPKAGCPACGRIPSRFLGILCSAVPGHTMLTEIGQSTLADMERVKDARTISCYAGTKWRLSRSASKKPLRAEYLESIPTSRYYQISDAVFIRAMARIYSLPDPGAGTTWETWPVDVVPALLDQLERCFVPMPKKKLD